MQFNRIDISNIMIDFTARDTWRESDSGVKGDAGLPGRAAGNHPPVAASTAARHRQGSLAEACLWRGDKKGCYKERAAFTTSLF
ncbi:hypothetical protein [Aromatoleum bremense]|uniref:Uncharacterized protein n=1 Tax=Aromatoleum bremense TaxID=76115 RepID=A0ABX1P227_9RHOO|nr:hypothetical protein [Aromatoleum bremense]NMG17672.1 hypothetical protein [Aromatoleum bremense]